MPGGSIMVITCVQTCLIQVMAKPWKSLHKKLFPQKIEQEEGNQEACTKLKDPPYGRGLIKKKRVSEHVVNNFTEIWAEIWNAYIYVPALMHALYHWLYLN